LTYQWNARPRVSPEGFTLELAVLRDGIPVGIQGLDAENWAVLRRVQTGSWLGRAHQGRGIGTRMRMLALHLIFDGLDAREATSGAFADNVASNAVSRRVGYLADGAFRAVREGAAVLHNRYVMPRARWESLRDEHRARLGSAVEIEGLPAFRNQVGLDPVG
jgi:RimJ/RimL family protein N-acetyltransferase